MGNNSSSSCLSDEDSSFLVKHTSKGVAEIQEWHKGFLQDCPSGELTKEQFVAMYSKMFPGGNANKFSENVFRTFDTNKNGTIDFREFMLALHVTSSGKPEEKLTWAFRMFDVDGSGDIDFNEMKRIVSAVYEIVGADGDLGRAQELFSKMDQNSDGSISQEEFVAIVRKDKSLLNLLQGRA
eukprot:TRINITY_DN30725_c0_g1_i1.p1 TRINITY_DN30725_c0_g1~~TRINITY_DN30725_c0_g1_i1.p1  ORF type:complete len:182 (-),score=62.30 TRINITY_DN30725_c0_g1_i1:77-622(-)